MKFKVLLKGELKGCLSSGRKKDIAIMEVYIPEQYLDDTYGATKYFEQNYKFFVLDILSE